MIIRMYGKKFYPSKKVCDSIFDQNGTADGYHKTDKKGVIRFFMLNGDSVLVGNKKLIKALKTGEYLHILFQSSSNFELRTLKYYRDGLFMTLWDVITIYPTKAKAYRFFRELLLDVKKGEN